jgi:hypothetical protein
MGEDKGEEEFNLLPHPPLPLTRGGHRLKFNLPFSYCQGDDEKAGVFDIEFNH